MNEKYLNPFKVNGITVSIMGAKLVRIYSDSTEVTDSERNKIDSVIQYLMDEGFIAIKTCRVEIFCSKDP
jgi:signal transduction histidine kinase